MPTLEHNGLVALFRDKPPLAPQLLESLFHLPAVAHGNGPNGLAVILGALRALRQLDDEHATVYFEVIYAALHAPMREALKAKIMENRTDGTKDFTRYLKQFGEDCKRDGAIEGKIEGKIEALLRLLKRAGIALTEDDRARIQTCADAATLDRWLDNVLGAKTAADVLT